MKPFFIIRRCPCYLQTQGPYRFVSPLNVTISFQDCDGIELLDWLFDQNDGILRLEGTGRHGNHHTWPAQDPNVRETVVISDVTRECCGGGK